MLGMHGQVTHNRGICTTGIYTQSSMSLSQARGHLPWRGEQAEGILTHWVRSSINSITIATPIIFISLDTDG